MVLLEHKQVNLLLVLMMVLNILHQVELTAWNTSQYLNIWVCDISGGILGYISISWRSKKGFQMGLFVIISILVIRVLPHPHLI